jgi:glycosyltransferase involved in cell wall biosynthesis
VVTALYTNWYVWKQRPHHLVEALNARGGRVNVFSGRGVRSRGPALPPSNRLTTHVFLPISQQHRAPIRIGNDLIRRALEERWVRAPADLHIHASPPLHALSRKPGRLVYDCLDDWSAYPGWAGRTEAAERALCEQADRVWVISRPLFERFAALYGDKVEYVPNGADCRHFERTPQLRAALKPDRPVLGYIGAISEWFDVELLRGVAERLPDWELRLVGPSELTPERRRRLDLPNVRFLGRRAYEELPRHLAEMDVATIPFVLNDLIKATSPIKLYEYLAAGVPVVSTSMPEVTPLVEPGVVACADDPASFAEAACALRDSGQTARRQELARQFSWGARFAGPLDRALGAA